jgi:hypothetical protein
MCIRDSPKSVPQELMALIPNLPSVAFLPIIQQDQSEYGMFEHFKKYPWVLEIYRYSDHDQIMKELPSKIIRVAENYLDSKK